MAGYSRIIDWLQTCGLDTALGAGDCESDCPADECDDCVGQQILETVVDQVCDEMFSLGINLAKAWKATRKD